MCSDMLGAELYPNAAAPRWFQRWQRLIFRPRLNQTLGYVVKGTTGDRASRFGVFRSTGTKNILCRLICMMCPVSAQYIKQGRETRTCSFSNCIHGALLCLVSLCSDFTVVHVSVLFRGRPPCRSSSATGSRRLIPSRSARTLMASTAELTPQTAAGTRASCGRWTIARSSFPTTRFDKVVLVKCLELRTRFCVEAIQPSVFLRTYLCHRLGPTTATVAVVQQRTRQRR